MKSFVGTRHLLMLIVILSFTSENYGDTDLGNIAGNLTILSNNLRDLVRYKYFNESYVVSPLLIQVAGAIMRIGATGRTAEELEDRLELVSDDRNEITQNYSSVLANYKNAKYVDLDLANKLYVNSILYQLQDDIDGLLGAKFFGGAEQLDFGKNVAAANSINEYVQFRTHNTISNVINSSDLDSNTRSVLVNAASINIQWLNPFDSDLTEIGYFHLNKNKTVKVPMMYREYNTRIALNLRMDAHIIDLPLLNKNLSMYIIFPRDRTTELKKVEENLKNVQLKNIRFGEVAAELRIPKFKTEFELDLKETFAKLGIRKLFDASAELGQFTKSGPNLFVTEAVHNTVIDVNEYGIGNVQPASATEWKKVSPRLNWMLNRPFVYVIWDVKNKIELFTGKVVKP